MEINKKDMICIEMMFDFCCGEGVEPNCSYDLLERIVKTRKK